MIIISPSLASANQLMLNKAIQMAESHGCADIHLDIEDGNFIPNITFGEKTVRAVCDGTHLPLSFHLMVMQQMRWLEIVSRYRPRIVFGHLEAIDYPRAFIGLARQLGVRCGIALNPRTPVELLEPYISDLEGILLLSVEPDGIGEHFMPVVYQRITAVRQLSPSVEIWVDGNITGDKLTPIGECGATHAVMGRDFYQR